MLWIFRNKTKEDVPRGIAPFVNAGEYRIFPKGVDKSSANYYKEQFGPTTPYGLRGANAEARRENPSDSLPTLLEKLLVSFQQSDEDGLQAQKIYKKYRPSGSSPFC